ncbi:MAG TPA: glycosyltransferase, partial [Kiloniellales bacterium]|nr:glycosyltransferase [Kiloniellales bacterium]
RLGLRVVLHEQNAVLGRANRLLAGRADAIATCFDRVDAIPEADRGKVTVTGNPVRAAVAALAHRPYPVPGESDRLRLLVIGGSLGASVFDELVPAALCRLPAELRGRISVTQQVRGAGSEAIAARYAAAGIACDLARFFDDLPQRLGAAHLVICRAGASTVAELAVAGRPSLLVPYPTATDDHQSANAERLAAAGAGWVMPQDALDADKLAERLSELLGNPGLLARAARCAAACGRHEAARALADLVCDLRGSNGDDASGSGEEAA